METPINPLAGTSLHELWYLKRKSPKGRSVHLIDPVSLSALCGFAHCEWTFPPETKSSSVCAKCRGVAVQVSLLEEIDNERLK